MIELMNLSTIERFLTVVEEGGISAASEKLFVSQQSLSEQMKALETTVGAVLFHRTKPLILTPAGWKFEQYARELIKTHEDLLKKVSQSGQEHRKKLIIAIPTYEAPLFLDTFLASFIKDNPNYDISVVKRQAKDIEHNMEGIDYYFGYLTLTEKNHVVLSQSPLAVAIKKSLFSDIYKEDGETVEKMLTESGDLKLLEKAPFIILLNRWGAIASHMKAAFEDAGFQPQIGFQSEIGELLIPMTRRGAGAYIMSYGGARTVFRGCRLVGVYPIMKPNVSDKLTLIINETKKPDLYDRVFIKSARKFFDRMNEVKKDELSIL